LQRIAALIDIGELHRLPHPQLARIRLLHTGDHPEQRRLSRSVRADHADDSARWKLEAQVVDQKLVRVALAQLLCFDDQAAQFGAGRDVDFAGHFALFGLLVEQLFVGSKAGFSLGLSGARGHPDPFELVLKLPLLRGLGFLLEPKPLLLLLEPGAVVALPGDTLAPVELQNPLRDVVQEISIVGDRHHRPGIFFKVLLEPGDGLCIEVVGGLIEKEQLRLLEEHPAQRHAPLFTAGKDRDLRIAGREPQGIHRDLQGAIQLPAIHRVDRILQLGLFAEELFHFCIPDVLAEAGGDLVEPIEQVSHRLDRKLHVALHVQIRNQLLFLGQIADPDAGIGLGVAEELRVHAGHNPKQRRFACPVRTDHADLRARKEREIDTLEDLLSTADRPQILHGEDEILRHPLFPPFAFGVNRAMQFPWATPCWKCAIWSSASDR